MFFYATTVCSLGLYTLLSNLSALEGFSAPGRCSHFGVFVSSATILMAILYYSSLKAIKRCIWYMLSARGRSDMVNRNGRIIHLLQKTRRKAEFRMTPVAERRMAGYYNGDVLDAEASYYEDYAPSDSVVEVRRDEIFRGVFSIGEDDDEEEGVANGGLAKRADADDDNEVALQISPLGSVTVAKGLISPGADEAVVQNQVAALEEGPMPLNLREACDGDGGNADSGGGETEKQRRARQMQLANQGGLVEIIEDDDITHVRRPPLSCSSAPGPDTAPNFLLGSEGREYFSGVKIWSNVYGLGIGVWCIVYTLQMTHSLGNVIFCMTLWGIFTGEYLEYYLAAPRAERPMMRYTKLLYELMSRDKGNYLLFPVIVILYPMSVVAHAAHAIFVKTDPNDMQRADRLDIILNILLPVTGALAIKYIKRPVDMVQTIEISAPVAGMMSICTWCIFLSGNFWCTLQQYVSVGSNVTLDMRDSIIYIYPASVVFFFLSPFLAVCAFVAVTSNFACNRTVDIAMFALWSSMFRMTRHGLPWDGIFYSQASILTTLFVSFIHVMWKCVSFGDSAPPPPHWQGETPKR